MQQLPLDVDSLTRRSLGMRIKMISAAYLQFMYACFLVDVLYSFIFRILYVKQTIF